LPGVGFSHQLDLVFILLQCSRSPFSVMSTWFSSPLPIFLFGGVDSVKLGAGPIQQHFGSVVASW
jgi:hypothetical protein